MLDRHQLSVQRNDFMREFEQVLNALTRGLRFNPQLKILWTVICAVPVDVVDVLIRQKVPAENFLHDKSMLEDVGFFCTGAGGMIFNPNEDVAATIGIPAAFPITSFASFEAPGIRLDSSTQCTFSTAELLLLLVEDV
jgi:hypothetical protein